MFAIKLAYFAIPVWSIAMTLIKTSIILTLLRLPLRRSYKGILYALLAIQLSFACCMNLLYTGHSQKFRLLYCLAHTLKPFLEGAW